MSKPCADCPFRRDGGIRIGPSQVRELVQLARVDAPQWCHKTVTVRWPERCRGSVLFNTGASPLVFASEVEMMAAQNERGTDGAGEL